ncbi:hypothetical protein [Nitrosomonas sp.]|uniref:hypothetical protein n=1 Tax=Nitrosomonas sp. TaxID=42353 RepID=UPI0035B11A57
MLPLWRDRIQVFLAPARLDWVRLKRGFKPVQLDKATVFFEPDGNAPDWEPALRQLDHVLSEGSGTQISIVLSNHFVRYAALPPQSEINTPEEVKSYAQFRMQEVYGERVESWALSVSDWNPVDGAVCAAIPRDLLARLEQLMVTHGCKLQHVEPYLASVYDHWCAHLQNEKIYLAVIETGRICIAISYHGRWQSIRNQRILHNAADDLLAALDQEVIWSGTKETLEFVYLFAPEYPDLTLPSQSGWQVVTLPQKNLPVPAYYPTVTVQQSNQNQCPA